jgi:phosphoribosylamine---glycine ligase
MKILILGDDGRAHALAWKLLNSPQYPEVVCAPGNGGTAPMTVTADLEHTDVRVVSRWAFDELFDLIVPASSGPLHAGLIEEALSLQVGVYGASQRATALERSRCRTKEFMLRHRLPTAAGRAFTSLEIAERFLATQQLPIMIKADHPAVGEELFSDRYAALEGLRRLFGTRPLEGQSDGVVVESGLAGPRVALTALTDGRTAVPLLATRLYDRVGEGDAGPVAAGVGAHTGSSTFAQQLTRFLHEKFILPIVAGLAQDDLPFWGFLGIDCIVTAEGPRLTAIRFSLREGEAQVVLPRFEDDLLVWMQAALARRLVELPPPSWTATPTVGVGLFARGYPGYFPYGGAIRGLEEVEEGVMVFHSATANPSVALPYTPRIHRGGALGSMLGGLLMGGQAGTGLHTTGGLPLTMVTQGATLAGARARALVNADRIQFEGRTYRGDIGAKEFG